MREERPAWPPTPRAPSPRRPSPSPWAGTSSRPPSSPTTTRSGTCPGASPGSRWIPGRSTGRPVRSCRGSRLSKARNRWRRVGGEPRLLALSRARFDLALRLRASSGAPLGEVFSFLSGLYFRGKLTYARAFANPPAGVPGVYVITPTDGLELAETAVDVSRLRRFASVDIRADDARFRRPLLRHAQRLAESIEPDGEVVLLGSIATPKSG